MSRKRDLFAEFEAAYATTPPWDIGRPQPAFAALVTDGGLGRTVLDDGCGTGEHVLMAAEAGSEATGIDFSTTAIGLAERKSQDRGILEGDPGFYGRLGFEYSAPLGIEISLPSWAPPEAAQVMRLSNYDPSWRGRVVYPPTFDEFAEH